MVMWVAVENFPSYEVSDDGRVRNTRTGTEKTLTTSNGYHVVGLWHKNVGKVHLVHRLVARAFIPGNFSLSVNHKDGNKTNNVPGNLEWCTLAENTNHQWKTGLANPSGCYTCVKVPYEDREKIRQRRAAGESRKAIAEEYNCHGSLISWICKQPLGVL